jgi:hypothetical protein
MAGFWPTTETDPLEHRAYGRVRPHLAEHTKDRVLEELDGAQNSNFDIPAEILAETA